MNIITQFLVMWEAGDNPLVFVWGNENYWDKPVDDRFRNPAILA